MNVDTSRDSMILHPPLRERWVFMQQEWMRLHPGEPIPFLTCTHRGPIDQARHLASGASHAPYGQSLHNFRPAFAFDVAFSHPFQKADWSFRLFEMMAAIGEPLGLEWGGRWPRLVDGPHFQMPMRWQDARDGNIPNLPPLPNDDSWKLVVHRDNVDPLVIELGVEPNLLTRYDAVNRRVHVRSETKG